MTKSATIARRWTKRQRARGKVRKFICTRCGATAVTRGTLSEAWATACELGWRMSRNKVTGKAETVCSQHPRPQV